MPDLTLPLQDLWVALNGRNGAGLGPLTTLVDREGIPGVATYALAKLRRKAITELQDLEQARLRLCKELAVKDEKGEPKVLEGGGFDIPELDVFVERFNALLAQQVTLTGVRKVRRSEFGNANVTMGEWDALDLFIDDEDVAAA